MAINHLSITESEPVLRVGRKLGKGNFTPEQKAGAVRLYVEGKTLWEAADTLGVTATTMTRWLEAAGIETRGGLRQVKKNDKLNRTQRESIVERYLSGESPTSIAKEFGITKGTIRDYAASRGHDAIHPTGRPKLYHPHESIFDEPPPGMPYADWVKQRNYWVGMLITDGCVVDRGKDISVCLSLARCDEHHIDAFRAFVNTQQPIDRFIAKPNELVKKPHPASRIAIYSRTMAESLIRFGVVPKKSRIARVVGLENDPDFWRGAIDGDGSIGYQKKIKVWTVRLCGMSHLIPQFYEFVTNHVGQSRAVISRDKRNLLQYAVHGWRAYDLLRIVYQDAITVLPRKAERAAAAIADYSQRQRH